MGAKNHDTSNGTWLAQPTDAALARVATLINMIARMVRTERTLLNVLLVHQYGG